MGAMVDLQAADGHGLSAYRADPAGRARGGVVIIQEIFGVNRHIRGVCDDYAREGYVAVAPALFDRRRRGLELGYTSEEIPEGREVAYSIPLEKALLDVDAAITAVRAAAGTAAVVGYCWGGLLAWLSATRLQPDVAVGYYGGRIAQYAAEPRRCPVMLHFGETDHAIPMDDVRRIRELAPDVLVHTYPAGHGFNCPERSSWDPACADTARKRTLAFLDAHAASEG